MSQEDIWKKSSPGSRNSQCKSPKEGICLEPLRNSKETSEAGSRLIKRSAHRVWSRDQEELSSTLRTLALTLSKMWHD